MKEKEIKQLGDFIRQVEAYKPKKKEHAPTHTPPKAELGRRWKWVEKVK